MADTSFRTAVHWQMTLIAARIYDRIKVHVELGGPQDRQYFKQMEVAFKKQKWHSVETATREHELIRLAGGDVEIAVAMQLQLAMNILEVRPPSHDRVAARPEDHAQRVLLSTCCARLAHACVVHSRSAQL